MLTELPTPISRTIPLDDLRDHPDNSNMMNAVLFEKLVVRLRDTGRYPPIIVRPVDDAFQILDGHHRVKALRQLGHAEARCDVWPIDESEALLLLATLNRLEGHDDPRKRAALLHRLHEKLDRPALAKRLPEDGTKLKRLLALHERTPPPRPPLPLADRPVAVHFFLLPPERKRLEKALKNLGGSREQALIQLVERQEHHHASAHR
jgi:ParB-like chromosome segregation protein Spo0J